MRNLLRDMLLVCLLALCPALRAQSRNPYDLEFHHLRSRWTTAGKLEKLTILDRVLHLRDYLDDPGLARQFLDSIRQSAAENALIQTEAAASLDDLRAFSLPAQPRTPHWYAFDEIGRV